MYNRGGFISKPKPITIGLILDQLTYSFECAIWHETVRNAKLLGHNLIIYVGQQLESPFRYTREENIIYGLVNKDQIDGLLISGSVSPYNSNDFPDFLNEFDYLPRVSLSLQFEGIHSVVTDNKSGMKQGVEHLVERHKCQKIAFVKGPDNNSEAKERYEGYLEVLREKEIPIDKKIIIDGDFRFESGVRAVEYLEHENLLDVDAIVCANDDSAEGLMEALHHRGIKIPGDIAVVGFDNKHGSENSWPALTTVEQPLKELVGRSYSTLVELINNTDQDMVQTLPSRLIERESCGCLPLINSLIIKEKNSLKKSDLLVSSNLTKLIDSFPRDLSSDKENIDYLYTLNNLMAENLRDNRIHIEWPELILELKRYIIKSRPDALKDDHFNQIFEISQILVSENYNKLEKTYKTKRDNKDFINRGFKQDLNFVNNINEICNIISNHFKLLGLNRAYLVLYDGNTEKRGKYTWNIPPDSQLLLAFEDKKNQLQPGERISFRTKDLLPDRFFHTEKPYTLAITDLYYQEDQYGYLMHDLNLENDDSYLIFQEHISSALNNLFMWEKRNQLEAEIQETLEQLKSSNRKLTHLDDMKNDFIANITHDFRSPLSIIINTTDIGIKYDDKSDAQLNERRLSTIQNASVKLKDAIDRLLDLAKMDAEGLKLTIEKVPPRKFLFQLVDFYKSSLLSSGINILEDLPLKEIDNFYTDIDKLEEILSNLISNAIKYVDSEKGEVVISLRETEKTIIIKIEDNGIGIEKDKVESIFNRFEQVESARNSQYTGTGLGLAFARQLTGFLKGSIHAESEGLNKGAAFILEFSKGKNVFDSNQVFLLEHEGKEEPLHQNFTRASLFQNELNQKKAAEKFTLEEMITRPNGIDEFDYKKGIILIIDDTSEIREIEKTYLLNAGFSNLICANNGKSGLEAVYQYRPDFILCDFNMPEMRGDAFHDTLVANPDFKKLPLVFVTALADRATLLDRQRKGAIAYLGKPINEDELITTVTIHMKKYMDYKEILMQATIDELTGINNRRNIMKLFKKQLTVRHMQDCSLIFFDIDHFKKINDTYGHQTGDIVLSELGGVIRKSIRPYDIAGRYGGEEFILILPETNREHAVVVAQKIQRNIQEMKIKDSRDKRIRFSASFGICSLMDDGTYLSGQLGIDRLDVIYEVKNSPHSDWEFIAEKKSILPSVMIEAADKALYFAKATHCNKCHFQSDKTGSFVENCCPECGSNDLTAGRNKIVTCDRIY
ncbi:MAG: diguanylate cyclase [Spirochaetaceae bacterium]|nr:diguanylate cyclase [Spirochaetaceae bacterium]